MGLDLGDAVPIGVARKIVLGRPAVDRERRGPGRFDQLAPLRSPGSSRVQPRRILAVTGVGAQAAATRSMIWPIRCGIAQQIRTAMGLRGDVASPGSRN